MQKLYFDSVVLFDRLYRLFITIIKKELIMESISDITPIQTLILYRIHDKIMKITDIINNKLYLGSNISYNLKQMVANGYININTNDRDKRVSYISLSDKGKQLYTQIDTILNKQTDYNEKSGITEKDIESLLLCGHNIENTLQKYFLESW